MSLPQNLGRLSSALTSDASLNIGVGVTPSGSFKLEVGTTSKFTGVATFGSTLSNGTYSYTLPSATGTLALTSDIHSAVTLSAIGATANANGATLTGQVLNLQPADASFGGVVTTGVQTFAGAKTLTGALSGTSATFSASTNALNIGNSQNSAIALSTFGKTSTSGYATANNYLQIGAGENATSSTRLIGFGYSITANTNQPAYIGYIETSNTGETKGSLVFGTRDVTTDTAPTERMRITSGGNVGIGTTSPTQLLQVGGNAGAMAIGDGLTSNGTSRLKFTSSNSVTNWQISNNDSIAGAFEIMPSTTAGGKTFTTPAFSIASTGQITQSTTISDWSYVMSNSNATSPNGIIIQYTAANKNNTSNPFLYCVDNSGATLRMEIRSNGGIANYSANDVNLSDERVKKDIEPLESYWDKFKAIEIVKFKYKDQTHDDFNIGVIAQQVEAVAPEFVDVDGWDNKPKLDEEGNEIINDEEPLKSIYTADLYHATIKVLQECMSKIESQQAQIEELKLLIK